MKTICCEITDKGSSKMKNQDSSFVGCFSDYGCQAAFGIICDGVGSYIHSELASTWAVNAFSDWFLQCYRNISCINDENEFCSILYDRWNAIFDNINDYIIRFSEINDIKLACTLSCILVRERNYYILHIGDTRIYSISEDIIRLTEDHTVTQRNIRQGFITDIDAKADSGKHILTKCLASKKHVSPDFYCGCISGTTKYLICSDGFSNNIDENKLLETFGYNKRLDASGLKKATKKVIRTDRSSGEKDNITAVVIQLSEE